MRPEFVRIVYLQCVRIGLGSFEHVAQGGLEFILVVKIMESLFIQKKKKSPCSNILSTRTENNNQLGPFKIEHMNL